MDKNYYDIISFILFQVRKAKEDSIAQHNLVQSVSMEVLNDFDVLLTFPLVKREHDMTCGRPDSRARVKMLRSSSTVTSTTAARAISRLKVIRDIEA